MQCNVTSFTCTHYNNNYNSYNVNFYVHVILNVHVMYSYISL